MDIKIQDSQQMPKHRADMMLGNNIVEIKTAVRDARHLRNALLQVASMVVDNDHCRGLLVLNRPELSGERVRSEFNALSKILRQEIIERIDVIIVDGEGRVPEHPSLSEKDRRKLELSLGDAPPVDPQQRGKPNANPSVLRLLLAHALMRSGTVPMKVLVRQAGFSYPAIARTLKDLGDHVHRASDRSASLASFPEAAWRLLVAQLPKIRPQLGFVIRGSDVPSCDVLLDRLGNLNLPEIAVGGARGLQFHFRCDAIASSAHLHLVLKTNSHADVADILRRLDAALEPVKPGETPTLVVHWLVRPDPLFQVDAAGVRYADPAECLLDLQESAPGFDPEFFLRTHL